MIFCWRISKRRYAEPPAAAFDGEGARRRGGRWSAPGRRVAYASSSLALAALEYFVNLGEEDAPSSLVAIRVGIPGSVRVEAVDRRSLPNEWRSYPYVPELSAITDQWLDSRDAVALVVPSAVISVEENVLINPNHSDFGSLIFHPPMDFEFDPRMWK